MFGKKKLHEPPNHIDSLIGTDTEIRGDINFEGGLRIDGRVTGNITASGDRPSTLIMSKDAFVQGQIEVSYAIINGTVVGPIHSHEYLELQAEATVSGAVSYKNMAMHIGATVNGVCRRLDKVQPSNKVVTLISSAEGASPSRLHFAGDLDER
ncbi:polymer-forming cytoskeletal protein [Nitrosovibrio sp. Nv6]|uniref:bactofilin family protein n=1 Tax=Nitrosovibrio sp. Nv6 TaxID=1855340 RepID=UPI0008CFE962|nr:polymer-forming cytoskeletal protein [Nitrosovibrio sp. Nv6]SEP37007.1 protein CcmA, bactofilin family [Nitrosovibrio sp. Nv6]